MSQIKTINNNNNNNNNSNNNNNNNNNSERKYLEVSLLTLWYSEY